MNAYPALGSLRRVDRMEAEVVTNGIYLTYRLKRNDTPSLRNLVEVRRFKHGTRHGEGILLHPRFDLEIRRAVVAAITQYRSYFTFIPPIEERYTKPVQLALPL